MTNDKIIEVQNLTKYFGDLCAVNNLNLNVYNGDVFGFLGPNGAGKSTTIRMLISLIAPTDGNIKIFGKELRINRIEILKKIGAIIEKPDFYGYLSAYKNLEILGKLSQIDVTRNRIMEVLELVGLEKRYKSKVKTYSFGMKQRLGLAQALIHDPELIILDEPTTGLDPQGMKEVRDLILFLSHERKKTIFISSHLLNEIELVANRMIIIDKGSAIVEGYVNDLLNVDNLKVTFEVKDTEKTKMILQGTSWLNKIESLANNKIVFILANPEISRLNKFMVENGIEVDAIIPSRSLEQYFLNITEKGF
ncbi:MAG: ABC transporter ATP-binding protein [Ignavibacteriaceae bacterium]|nr:ABC transporter ATP-binding protein [Ignavibacteriaceae bacterium]